MREGGGMETTEIGVPIDEIRRREDRVLAVKRFEEPDRVPVLPAVGVPLPPSQDRSALSARTTGIPRSCCARRSMGQKWLMENIRTDAYSITGAWTGAWTDFENTFEAGSLGCAVEFPDDDIPWVGGGLGEDGGRPAQAGGDGLRPRRAEPDGRSSTGGP